MNEQGNHLHMSAVFVLAFLFLQKKGDNQISILCNWKYCPEWITRLKHGHVFWPIRIDVAWKLLYVFFTTSHHWSYTIYEAVIMDECVQMSTTLSVSHNKVTMWPNVSPCFGLLFPECCVIWDYTSMWSYDDTIQCCSVALVVVSIYKPFISLLTM